MQNLNRGSIHSLAVPTIAYAAAQCPNGEQGRLVAWQAGVESRSPSIHLVDCSNHRKSSSTTLSSFSPSITWSFKSRIRPRQSPMCQDPCTTTCYTSNIQYNAADCEALSNWMWDREGQFPIDAGERVVMTWGTCMYTFTNDRPNPVTWCDAQWAQIGSYIARPCQASPNGGGGVCQGSGFKVEVLANDGSTNSPTPFSRASISPSTATSSHSSTHTEVPLPLVTTAPPSNSPTSSQYGNSNIPILPLIIALVAGVTVVILVLLCSFMIWRRSNDADSSKPNEMSLLPSSGGGTSNQGHQKQQFHTQESVSEHSHRPILHNDRPNSRGNANGSRGPTRLSTYTLDFDPFRALRRAMAGHS
ncbi:hypothetical protein CPB86DRAFT_810908 [Serendipita vermifera]|nr:hypothetical protein CPB86DRAFT_810908 [Serendipita vermifera]